MDFTVKKYGIPREQGLTLAFFKRKSCRLYSPSNPHVTTPA